MFYFGDIHRPAVQTAKAEITWARAEHINLPQHLTCRRQHDHGALAVACDVKIAGRITAHAVKAVIGKLPQQPLVRHAAIWLDVKHPHIALHTFVHVQPLAVRAHLHAIGRSHIRRQPRGGAVRINPPQLTGLRLPVRIAGVQRAIGRDSKVVRLVHHRLMRQHSHGPRG